jgi:predicted signal transduction protein with EAL and GGDEF domain
MYRAKARGRGQFEIFDASMHALASSRLALETDIRRALDRGEFRVFYQPLVDLEHGGGVRLRGAVRWEHPQRGWLAPADLHRRRGRRWAPSCPSASSSARGLPDARTWRRQYALPVRTSA